MDSRWTFVTLKLTSEKRFLSPRWGSSPLPSEYFQVPTSLISILFNRIINLSWFPHRQHTCRTCTSAHHLGLGSSMVRVSHRSSKGCGFDPRLGLRNSFECLDAPLTGSPYEILGITIAWNKEGVYSIEHYGIYTRPLTVRLIIFEGGKSRVSRYFF